ncbi:hotdog family protein [Vibrio amylolyticus]|uniref:hotdog family protein n=1 Tax=Vibrio amylolyticus TaxID=2847292 RepID=UPI00355317D2
MNNIPSIEQLLPHDRPMILIDRALNIEAESIHAQVNIGEHNLFFDKDSQSIPAYVGIEFMAQSVAAWSGYHALQKGEQPPIGFLLGSRRYAAHCDTFLNGQVLDIHAEQVMENNGMAVFSASISFQGKELATCQLNVYVPNEQKLQEMNIRNQA